MLKLFLFGMPRLEYKGQILEINRRKALALAAYVAQSNKMISRDILASLLWPEATEEQAKGSLRTVLHALTAGIPAKWLVVDSFHVTIDESLIEVDTHLFSKYLTQSRQHSHKQNILCADCAAIFQHAEALYTGPFLAGFAMPESSEYEDWQAFHATLLQREYAGILRRLAYYYYEQTSDPHQAIQYALRWLALDSLHEPAHRLLMQLYHEMGQRSEALRQYQTCIELLDQELAATPEDETVYLYESIRDGFITTITRPVDKHKRAVASFLPPVPPLLVGREQAMSDVKARLGIRGNRRLTTVIQGLPGVGKSTIAASLAHDSELTAAFSDGILWTSLGEQPDVLSKLRSWAEVLQIEIAKTTTIEALSTQISTKLHDKQMLLIVDDVWQVEHSVPFRVGGSDCPIVFTSRLNDIAMLLTASPLDLYNLPVLGSASALHLLRLLTPNTVHDFPDASLQLMNDLEGLPLAIQVAGRLLQNEERLGWGVEDLLMELREGSRLLDEPAPSDMMRVYQGTTPTISALLRRSTDTLNPLTRERFALLGLFVPKPATFDLGAIHAMWGGDDPKPTTRELVNRGLLEPVGGGRFQMHALLVAHARSMLDM